MAALAGCAHRLPPPLPAALPNVELVQTPFFPQRAYQCGPAALATVLAASGVDVTPDALSAQMYLPQRHGSLQTELIAAARRQGRLAVPLAANPQALVHALRAGDPPLLLLNLGTDWLPVWHYAVVVGYQPEHRDFILRSGRDRRRWMSAESLMRSWARAGHWGVVVASPDAVPETASLRQWLTAAAPLESLGEFSVAQRAYRAAAQRWPDEALVWTALGTLAARQSQWREALRAYDRSLALRPGVEALNNRATVLGAMGCRDAAIVDLAQARRLDTDSRHAATLSRTLAELPAADACAVDRDSGSTLAP